MGDIQRILGNHFEELAPNSLVLLFGFFPTEMILYSLDKALQRDNNNPIVYRRLCSRLGI